MGIFILYSPRQVQFSFHMLREQIFSVRPGYPKNMYNILYIARREVSIWIHVYQQSTCVQSGGIEKQWRYLQYQVQGFSVVLYQKR